MAAIKSAKRPQFDQLIRSIVDYVYEYDVTTSELAMETAHYCLFDTMGCAMLALSYPACTKLLGPVVPGATLKKGAKVPGTDYQLEPVQAAFNFGAMVRWLDYNDTWLAAEWGHPSDNLGAILMVADYLSRQEGAKPITMATVLMSMIKAHEIQGVLALNNSFNRVGLDHVFLVRIASTAVVSCLLGATKAQAMNAISQAFVDGGALRTYRHAPNTGSRKSWAAGDACRRAVQLALISLTDEMGYPSAITAKTWGFDDVLMRGNPLSLEQDFGTYVMENVLFKISFPAEFHAQTAVEAAIELHPEVKNRFDDIQKICIETQESAVRIIDKVGPLDNPADRDHCLQYMTVIALLKGKLLAKDYEDDAASDPRVDHLRSLCEVVEKKRFTKEYLEADKRYIGNAVQVFFNDGTHTDRVSIDYPVGHRCRREQGIPLLVQKCRDNLSTQLSSERSEAVMTLLEDKEALKAMSVTDFVNLF